MKLLKKISYLLLLSLFFIACEKDNTPQEEEQQQEEETQPRGDYDLGILITNEGPFNTGTGTVSYVSEDFQNVANAIYNTVNNEDLGNIVQSIAFKDDLAYVVVNNSNRIVVVNRYTFEKQAVIENGLVQPRNMAIVNNTGYVTNWGDPFVATDDFVAVLDLLTNEVTSTIPVDFGPEAILAKDQNLYVAHQGGYDFNNKISVINSGDNSVTTTIDVGFVPNSMSFFGDDLWVLCGGKPNYADVETAGSIVKINTSNNTVSQTIDFPETTNHPNHLTMENSDIYYVLGSDVYKMDVAAGVLPANPIISNVFFYSMTVHNGKLYGTDAGDYQSDGFLKVYDLSNNQEIQNITVGLIPGGVYFNEAE